MDYYSHEPENRYFIKNKLIFYNFNPIAWPFVTLLDLVKRLVHPALKYYLSAEQLLNWDSWTKYIGLHERLNFLNHNWKLPSDD